MLCWIARQGDSISMMETKRDSTMASSARAPCQGGPSYAALGMRRYRRPLRKGGHHERLGAMQI